MVTPVITSNFTQSVIQLSAILFAFAVRSSIWRHESRKTAEMQYMGARTAPNSQSVPDFVLRSISNICYIKRLLGLSFFKHQYKCKLVIAVVMNNSELHSTKHTVLNKYINSAEIV
jgi:hypothetical protein